VIHTECIGYFSHKIKHVDCTVTRTSVSGMACWTNQDQTTITFDRNFQQGRGHLSQRMSHYSIRLYRRISVFIHYRWMQIELH